MAKTIQHGKPRPNRGNTVKTLKRVQKNEELISRLKKA